VIATRPVFFMGIDTGLRSSGAYRAALTVRHWLIDDPNAPKIPDAYLCEKRRYPSIGRLFKNTAVHPDRFDVGLGLPDRRKKP
jgi:hypothetical protein